MNALLGIVNQRPTTWAEARERCHPTTSPHTSKVLKIADKSNAVFKTFLMTFTWVICETCIVLGGASDPSPVYYAAIGVCALPLAIPVFYYLRHRSYVKDIEIDDATFNRPWLNQLLNKDAQVAIRDMDHGARRYLSLTDQV